MAPSLVVLTDFFAVSNRALSYAAGLAVPLHAQLVLLHVRHDGLLAPETYSSLHTRQGERQTTQALQQLAAEQPVPAEVDISGELLPEAVAAAVRQHQPLLLVLGQPGASTVPPEEITATALELLRHVPYPLLVVPTVGWDVFPPRRFLLALDGQPFRLFPQPDVLRQLLAATAGTLAAVQVAGAEAASADPGAVLETIRVNSLVDELPVGKVYTVAQSNVAEGILQEASRQAADVVVVVARRHSLLGSLFHHSVTAQLLRECPVPVLLLPAED
ncbi:universal stress protein [Hymenobacter lutimineralis]|nr:universal stress protein [Hymenobacter lutimineralis]